MNLFAHQQATVDFLLRSPRSFITSDPGTGKTLSCLAAFQQSPEPDKRLLVVAPLSILQASWGEDIKRFMPQLRYTVAHGTRDQKLKALGANVDVVITNHDTVRLIAQEWQHLPRFSHLVVDEFTAFKNRTAQRSAALGRFAHAIPHCWLLSGTPNSNTILDLWYPAWLVDRGQRLGTRYFAFRDQVCYAEGKGRFVRWVDKPEALAVVTDMLRDITIRYRLEDCLDMPEHVVSDRRLAAPAWLLAAYRHLQEESHLATKDGEITAVHAAARVKKLLQLLSGAVYDEHGVPLRVHTERTELVMELALERPQVVIAYNWRHELDALKALCEKHGVSYGEIHGGTSLPYRSRMVAEFQAGQHRIMLCHPQSAGHGLTLTAGHATLWASPTYNAEHYAQFNHRIYRAGQTKRTETIRIAYADTAEIAVYERLDGKLANMEELLQLFARFTTQAVA